VNAKYDALENDHRQVMNQLLALMSEREELLGTVSPPADTCGSLSPEAVLGSRRTSVVDEGAEDLLNGARRAEGQ
jgi:hypothetical protein